MKVKYIGINNLDSRGISFSEGMDIIEVPDADGRYFIGTFPSYFEEIEEKKVEVKKPVVDKKKAD